MSDWIMTPFSQLLVDSKDGEWGEAEGAVGLREAIIIRGTDFSSIDNPGVEFPRRWVRDHIIDRKQLQPGDIILETAGGTSTQSTGRSALLKGSFFLHHCDLPVLCASFSRHLRLDTNKYSPCYIYYLLQTLHRSGYMAVFNIQHTGVSRFQYTAFKKHTELSIPELPIQRQIAATLAACDELIENNNRRIALLEQTAEEIYREWFVRLRYPGYKSETSLKGIPQGWKLVKLECAFTFTGGGTPSKDVDRFWNGGDVNWFTPSDITGADGIFLEKSGEQCTEEGLNNSSARMFPAYSVMLTSRATIGAIGINLTPACTNQGFISCIPNARYPLPYLYHWLKLAKPHFEILASGATFAELTKGTFKRIEILTPPEPLVNEFARIEMPLLQSIETQLRANRKLVEMRDRLLSRLISGKLSVENVNIEFPPDMAEELKAKPGATAHG
jgi:type I restriction enzyme, S subunit